MSVSASLKATLRLPESKLRPLPSALHQPLYLARCTSEFYRWQAVNRPADRLFRLQDGPPYANGRLHVGHALNKILKDMILRVKVQNGFRVDYVLGWDCHGLPIELKAVGSDVKGMTPAQIRQAARKLAGDTVELQEAEFRSFAVMSDQGRWTTMDADYEIRQLELFQKLVARGFIRRRRKPVYWSPSSKTALAEAELEYEDQHVSRCAYVRYPIRGGAESLGFDGPLYAVVWTTTPWTLPANRAIAVHNELEYCIVQKGSDGFLVARSRLDTVQSFLGEDAQVVVPVIQGSALVGLSYANKLRGREAPLQPVIHAGFVSADSGTGLVHIAPGHGQDDYEACLPHGILAVAPIDDAGHFTADAYPDEPEKLTSAPSILDGGANVVLDLVGEDVLHTHKHRHRYPYDWRTKRPVVLRATEQWFADVGALKQTAVGALKDVQFVPSTGFDRLKSFIEARSDWCISRQRAWGVPIPALFDDSGEAVMTSESIQHIIGVVRSRGIDAWFSDDPYDPAWLPPDLVRSGKRYRRGTDTMDVWFDSGSSWTQAPARADVYVEGSDQHRGWFQSSLLTRIAAGHTDAPFKTLITHGFTLDQRGKKMSKSLGNVVLPLSIMDGTLLPPLKPRGKPPKAKTKAATPESPDNSAANPAARPDHEALGADALRLWVAGAEYTRDVVIGQVVIQNIHQVLRKYRAVLRMMLGSLSHEPPAPNPLTKLDRLALAQLQAVMDDVGRSLHRFEFQKASRALNQWVAADLSAFYIAAVRDRLYCGDGGGVFAPLLVGLLRMLAPMTPLLVEEAWAHWPDWMKLDPALASNPATHLFDAPLFDPSVVFAERSAETVRADNVVLAQANEAVKAALERLRAGKVLGSSLQSAIHVVIPDPANREVFEHYADELDAVFVVSSVKVASDAPPESCLDEQAFEAGTIYVTKPSLHKCGRCWRFLAPAEDGLCGRCDQVVASLVV